MERLRRYLMPAGAAAGGVLATLLVTLALGWISGTPEISLPAEVRVAAGEWFTLRASTSGRHVAWHMDAALTEPIPPELRLPSDRAKVLVAKQRGVYVVHAWTAAGSRPSELATCRVVVGEPGPVPPGPTPPGPGPTPVPPSPAKGLRVMFVYETSELSKLTAAQSSIMTATAIREYLKAKCEPDGFRFYDRDVNTANETDVWRGIWSASKATLPRLPAVVIVTDQKGEAFPLPKDVDETLALLKRYAG